MLQILPTHISNLIAAGEVINRPSSVVKELLENSVDAGAKSITVNISDSGRTLIQVIDDGGGMTPEEAKTCFLRHATSKISTAADLEAIMTYGFRGEALASIAAVSNVSLKTKKSGSDVGTEVVFAESKLLSEEAITCSDGTNISVRNIFYNVPARRKFLKSENAEFRHITTEFIRVALCHPEINLKLTHNKKDLFTLRATNMLKQRILEVAGKDFIKELVDLNTTTEFAKIYGFIGKPEDARKSVGNQYFFVNGRFFRSPYLHKAVLKAYEKLIPEGYTPSYFIFIETEPESIDINIHPAKIEVKFENESILFEVLNASVREVLGRSSFAPSIDFDTEGVPEIPIPLKGGYIRPPKIDYDPLFNPFQNSEGRYERPYKSSGTQNRYTESNFTEGSERVFEEKHTGGSFIVLQNKYILTPVKSGVLLIHISRAKERIFYERYLKSLDNEAPIIQCSLFEEVIELDPISYSILMEDAERLKNLGFDIRPFGGNSVIVSGLPDGYSADPEAVRLSIDELVSALSEAGSDPFSRADGRSKIAEALAKSGAREGNYERFTNLEAQLLVDSLFLCNEPGYTVDGRSCMTILTMDEIQRFL